MASREGPEGRWARLFDVGGTVFAQVDESLYRAEGARLVPVSFRVDAGDAGAMPKAVSLRHVMGRYPDNVWVTVLKSAGCRNETLLVGRLEGGALVGHHVDGTGMGGIYRGIVPWVKGDVLQTVGGEPTAPFVLHEGGGRERSLPLAERPVSCERPYVAEYVAQGGWVLAEISCMEAHYTNQTMLFGPAGQRVDASLVSHATALLATAKGEVFSLDDSETRSAPGQKRGAKLCKLVPAPASCEVVGAVGRAGGLISSARGMLITGERGVFERGEGGALEPVELLPAEMKGLRVGSLVRASSGELWAVVKKKGGTIDDDRYRVMQLAR